MRWSWCAVRLRRSNETPPWRTSPFVGDVPASFVSGEIFWMSFTIGQGVLDAMGLANDEPRSDEEYHHSGDGNVLYSETQGRDAIYRWTPEDGVKVIALA
jgi:hypothetical protein